MALKDEYFVMEPDLHNTSFLELNKLIYPNSNSDSAVSSLVLTKAAYIHNSIKVTIIKEQQSPAMTDFMYFKSAYPILHKRLLEILLPLKLRNTQHFPVLIKDRKNVEHKDFFMWHIYNVVDCLDPKKSNVDRYPSGGFIVFELQLDNAKLNKVPLEHRLVFRLGHSEVLLLVHKSLVDKFKQKKVSGVKFYPVNTWRVGNTK
ncbi:hypothetical protein MNBD_GAMMA12-2482 [hydrothermal vent metagenome]|uniref:Immunity MXAN-0049 protein domain-containing protein n=1 Tax=hydrothermal vent metagenome TaxID=652676 RepID=A0A3B0YPA5_9ZZZZ